MKDHVERIIRKEEIMDLKFEQLLAGKAIDALESPQSNSDCVHVWRIRARSTPYNLRYITCNPVSPKVLLFFYQTVLIPIQNAEICHACGGEFNPSVIFGQSVRL